VATGGSAEQPESDARLISRILAGETDLYQEVVRRYQRMVASVAYRMGLRQDDMEDLISEVFIKAYRNLSLYRPEHAFSTWLYRLATNRTLDALRARRRALRTDPLDERLADGGAPTDRGLEEKDRSGVVARALQSLPEEYRAPIVLLHLEDRKVSEIAAVLGIPEGTVKTRLARGRARLKKILARDFPEYCA
jgi:RNA polymerase sigma-70 factor (ECF subfamily)